MKTSFRFLLAGLALAAGCTLLNDPGKIEPSPDTTPPPTPTGLVAVPGNTTMTLAWDPVIEWDFDHYAVYYALTGQTLAAAGDTQGTTFTLTGLDNAQAYDFVVLSVDRFGNVSDPSMVTAQPDGVAPTVTATTFNPGPQTGASLMTDVIFTFSEPMDMASIVANSTVSASAGTTPACAWSFFTDDTEAKCDLVVGGDPAAPLAYSTTYTVTLAAGVTDRAGNGLAGTPVAGAFTTAATPDTTPPALNSVAVSNYQSAATAVGTGSPGAQGVFPETNVVFTFSEPMDTVATAGAISVTGGAGYNGGVKTWNAEGTVLTFNPDVDYLSGATVTISIASGAKDVAQNPLPAFTSRTFKIAYRTSATLESEAGIDGYGYATSGGGSVSVYPTGSSVYYGDAVTNGQYKGFLSFNRGSPTNLIRYTAATLGIHQVSCTGSPYTNLRTLNYCFRNPITGKVYCYYTGLQAVHVNLGTALDAGDFTTAALPGTVGIGGSTFPADYTASVLTAVEDDRTNGRGRSQWRLEFPVTSNNDALSDYCSADAGEAAAGTRPSLVLTYDYW